MYSDKIVERRIGEYQRSTGRRLRQVDVGRVRSIVHYLEGKVGDSGKPVRPPVTAELAAFIENERAMCKASFRYWAERYAFIEYRVGRGGVDLFKPLESQLLLLEKLAIEEEKMWERKDQGDSKFLGLCFMIHKARQLGFTTLCQLLLLHLQIFYSEYRSLSASVDEKKTGDMHDKWRLAYSRLPHWMQTPITSSEKNSGEKLANGSYSAMQEFSQKSGLGQGMTWSACHFTEVAAVPDDYCKEQIQNHFFPSLADTIRVIAFMESTAQGSGNWWHQTWQLVDAGLGGRWRPAFVPAYAEPLRWSRPFVPDNWKADADTLAYEQKIISTSPKYMNGRTVRPDPRHLVFWQEERELAIKTGTLNLFLANYCVTPEESFQYSQGGAFNPLIITSISNRIDKPAVAYELVSTPSQRQAVRERMNVDRGAPRILTAGPIDLVPVHTTPRDEKDPRGLILLFEPPRIDAVYSIGADPAVGIVGWDRRYRSDTKEELERDNAVASGWYRDSRTGLTTQAFEFAGPISAREFAKYLYALAKLYAGAAGPDRGAQVIIELNNGGTEVQNVLTNDYRFYSLWQRIKSDGMQTKQLEQWGWISTLQSVQELWVYGKDVIEQPVMPIRPQSTFLMEEMGLCRWDPLRRRGEVPEGSGKHDDRVSAMLFALWQLRGFVPMGTYGELARQIANTQHRSGLDFQQMDIASLDEYNDAVDAWHNRILYG